MSDPRDEALGKIGEAIAQFMNDDIEMGEVLRAAIAALDDYERAPAPRRRRVVQVAVARSPECIDELYRERLCDDGSVWLYWEEGDKGPRWVRLPDVPQDEDGGES